MMRAAHYKQQNGAACCHRDIKISAGEKCMTDAGFTEVTWKEKPNEYGSSSYRGNWFDVTTDIGTFTIGWRKRVVEVTFPETLDMDCREFVPQDTTRDTHMFHAWSDEELTKQLMAARKQIIERKNPQ